MMFLSLCLILVSLYIVVRRIEPQKRKLLATFDKLEEAMETRDLKAMPQIYGEIRYFGVLCILCCLPYIQRD